MAVSPARPDISWAEVRSPSEAVLSSQSPLRTPLASPGRKKDGSTAPYGDEDSHNDGARLHGRLQAEILRLRGALEREEALRAADVGRLSEAYEEKLAVCHCDASATVVSITTTFMAQLQLAISRLASAQGARGEWHRCVLAFLEEAGPAVLTQRDQRPVEEAVRQSVELLRSEAAREESAADEAAASLRRLGEGLRKLHRDVERQAAAMLRVVGTTAEREPASMSALYVAASSAQEAKDTAVKQLAEAHARVTSLEHQVLLPRPLDVPRLTTLRAAGAAPQAHGRPSRGRGHGPQNRRGGRSEGGCPHQTPDGARAL